MNKKILLYLIVIIIIIFIFLISSKNSIKESKIEEQKLTETDIQLNNALSSDSTGSIKDNLDNINVEDTTENDLKEIDDELNNL